MQWYYAHSDIKRGPVTGEELEHLYKDGIISKDTLVWRDGMEDWVKLAELPELASSLSIDLSQHTAELGELAGIEESANAVIVPPPFPNAAEGGQIDPTGGVMPASYITQAVIGLVIGLMCCAPVAGFAVVAIVKGNKVKELYDAGDYVGAQEASQKAKYWCNVTAIALVVVIVIGIIANVTDALN
ncbi:MAG: GYF domain-containing protein [Verrucomicrobiales bacterium]|nr:GYF domain-containing protein [Verrucomicrobiales bacterium]